MVVFCDECVIVVWVYGLELLLPIVVLFLSWDVVFS